MYYTIFSIPSIPGCLSTEIGNNAEGEGELALPDIWASSKGGTAEEYSEGILELGTGPVGLIILSNACAKKTWVVFNISQKFCLQYSTMGGVVFFCKSSAQFLS